MMTTLGTIIRRCRREKDWTQEEMAAMLNVSPQTISRWETGDAMPDISLLPPIANLLEVSTDTLLGVDVTQKGVRIRAIIERSSAARRQPYTEERNENIIRELREGLRLYPDAREIRHELVIWLYPPLTDETRAEMVKYCEELLADSTDPVERAGLIGFMSTAAKDTGKTEQVLKLARTLPPITFSQEAVTARCLSGEAQEEAYRRLLNSAYIQLGSALHFFACNRPDAPPEEILRYIGIRERLAELIYENDDMVKYGSDDEWQAARALAKAGDRESAFRYLERFLEKERHTLTYPLQLSDLRERSHCEQWQIPPDPADEATERRANAKLFLELAVRDFPEEMRADPRFVKLTEALREMAGE